jgi:hypothetical protein
MEEPMSLTVASLAAELCPDMLDRGTPCPDHVVRAEQFFAAALDAAPPVSDPELRAALERLHDAAVAVPGMTGHDDACVPDDCYVLAALRGAAVSPVPPAPIDVTAMAWCEWCGFSHQIDWPDCIDTIREGGAAVSQSDSLDVERPRYSSAYVDGRMCHNCGLEPYQHECPKEASRGE